MIYSSWRPNVQSEEYQQLLHFCQENGRSVWLLLFQKLNTESWRFTGGLIIDSTLPDYLYYLERTVDESQSEETTSGGNIAPA